MPYSPYTHSLMGLEPTQGEVSVDNQKESDIRALGIVCCLDVNHQKESDIRDSVLFGC